MSYDPSIVGRYGNLVEIWAAGKYPIELDYSAAWVSDRSLNTATANTEDR